MRADVQCLESSHLDCHGGGHVLARNADINVAEADHAVVVGCDHTCAVVDGERRTGRDAVDDAGIGLESALDCLAKMQRDAQLRCNWVVGSAGGRMVATGNEEAIRDRGNHLVRLRRGNGHLDIKSGKRREADACGGTTPAPAPTPANTPTVPTKAAAVVVAAATTAAVVVLSFGSTKGSDVPAIQLAMVADKGSSDRCGGEDWLGIENTGGAAVDVTGYKLSDDKGLGDEDAFTFPSGSEVAGGETMVLCRGSNGSFTFKIGGDDTVSLHGPDDAVLDTTTLADDGGLDRVWARGAAGVWAYRVFSTTPPLIATAKVPTTPTPTRQRKTPKRIMIITPHVYRVLQAPPQNGRLFNSAPVWRAPDVAMVCLYIRQALALMSTAALSRHVSALRGIVTATCVRRARAHRARMGHRPSR